MVDDYFGTVNATDLKEAGFEIIKIEGVKYFSNNYNDNYFAIVKSV